MLLALDWKTVIYMTVLLHEVQEWRPCLICIATLEEGLCISNHVSLFCYLGYRVKREVRREKRSVIYREVLA